MKLSNALISFMTATAAAVFVASAPLQRRETSYGDPDLITDQGNRWKLNFGDTEGHDNACPGSYICYIPKNGEQHDDVSLGDPDDFVDEGNRWRINYESTDDHPNACDGHYICYIYK